MSIAAQVSEARSSQRTNTLLAAIAKVGNTAWPVKVRNISASGAMIESSVHADVGASVTISRGDHHASGQIIWRRETTIGVRFFHSVAPEDWLSIPTRLAAQEVPLDNGATDTSPSLPDDVILHRLREELSYVSRMLECVAHLLSDDPVLRVRHTTKLQELSIGSQMIREIALVLERNGLRDAVESNVTGPMRQRLLRRFDGL